jgi:putative membrane protein
MNSSEPAPSIERRLHSVGMLLVALEAVRRWIGLAAFPGIAALFNGGFGMQILLLALAGVALLGVLSAVWGVLTWRATTYRVSGGAFHLRRGVLRKSERSLPLEHIQSVNTVQGLVQRLFGVVEVRVEAAGGGEEPEIRLPALSQGAAGTLREELTSIQRVGPKVSEEPAPTVLRRLSGGDLLVAGLTSGQIGIAASVVFGASEVVDRLLPGDLGERLSEILLPRTLSAALFLVLAITLFAWTLAILGTIIAHGGFTLSRSADGEYLYIQRGLLKRYESAVPLTRIQAIRVVEGVLRQPLGYATLRVESAGFANKEGVSTALFPLLPREEVEGLLRAATPQFAAPLDHLEPLPGRARRRYAVRTALPMLLISTLCAIFLFPWGLTALLLILPAILYGLSVYQAAGHTLDDSRLVLRFRRLGRTTVIVPAGKLQARGYSISPFQWRKELATLKVEVTSGSGRATFHLTDMEAQRVKALVEELSPHVRQLPVQGCSA